MNFHKLAQPRDGRAEPIGDPGIPVPRQGGAVLSARGVSLPGFCERLLLAAVVPHDTGGSPGGMWLQVVLVVTWCHTRSLFYE